MPQHPTDLTVHDVFWRSKVVYGMATVCLLLGLAIGYLLTVTSSTQTPLCADPWFALCTVVAVFRS